MTFRILWGTTGLLLVFGSLVVNHRRPEASQRFRDNVDAVGWMGLAMCIGLIGSVLLAEHMGWNV